MNKLSVRVREFATHVRRALYDTPIQLRAVDGVCFVLEGSEQTWTVEYQHHEGDEFSPERYSIHILPPRNARGITLDVNRTDVRDKVVAGAVATILLSMN